MIEITTGQLAYQWEHLEQKRAVLSPDRAAVWHLSTAQPHPIFTPIDGPIADWDRP